MLGIIRIDRKMKCPAIQFFREGVDQRILSPDARMMKLCLMSGGNQQSIIVVPQPIPETRSNFRKRNILNSRCLGRKLRVIVKGLTDQLGRTGPKQDLPVLSRGLPSGVALGQFLHDYFAQQQATALEFLGSSARAFSSRKT